MAKSDILSTDLLDEVSDDAKPGWPFFILMTLSGALVAVAFLTESIPILIGAMIVAPLLPPTALVALAIVFGRPRTAMHAVFVSLSGLTVAVLAAIAVTVLLNAWGVIPEDMNLMHKTMLQERLRPGWYSIIVGAAAGIASMMGLVRKKMDTLIGSVTALALVPAGGACAIALISGGYRLAFGGFLLLAINYMLIIAFGILTLLVMRRTSQTVIYDAAPLPARP